MKVSKCAHFKADIKTVWNVVTDNTNYAWRNDLKRIIIHDQNNFTEIDKNDYKVDFKITDFDIERFYAFEMSSRNTEGFWSGTFKASEEGGTDVEFVENVTGKNIFMNSVLKIFLRKHQARYIKDLQRALNE